MTYTRKIKDALRFAIKTHEIYQKQKRKGKDIPYITHPLTVGLILARAKASEDAVVAGILHDTNEDSIDAKKVTSKMLTERFGRRVSRLVLDVTEKNKKLPWEKRKIEAIKHIKHLSRNSLFLKSADVIANVSETLDDYERGGDAIFSRFKASKDMVLRMHVGTIKEILKFSKDRRFSKDLTQLLEKLRKISSVFAAGAETAGK